MDFENLLSIGVILLYSLGTFGILVGALASRPWIKNGAHAFTFSGFLLHTALGVNVLVANSFAELPAGYYMQLFAWCLIFLYLAAWRWLRSPFLGLTSAPLALLLYALSMRLAGTQDLLPQHLSGLFFGLHIWALYLSLGLLALAFGAGLLFVYLERRLKRKERLAPFTKNMPSLAACDKVNLIAVIAGFPFYTLGVMAGFIWVPMAAAEVVANPKVVLSLFIWVLYALLFYQRTALGFRGRKTAVMAIAIFIVSVLSIGIDHSLSHHSTTFLP